MELCEGCDQRMGRGPTDWINKLALHPWGVDLALLEPRFLKTMGNLNFM